ncbi:hypothetical protein KAR91_73985 [Candidatus Pacearchaeota archaeon]|nr:hypothetical protein [Candidatus Pacearchaeota archaeon]
MLTESFLNSCFSVVLNKTSKVKKNKALYRDILSLLEFQEKKAKLDVPMTIQNKFDCLRVMCTMKMQDKSDESMIDSISFSEKFRPLSDFVAHKAEEVVQDLVAIDIVKQIRLRKKLNSLMSNYDDLSRFLEAIKDGTFESIDDVVLDYEEIVRSLYTNMMDENRGVAIEATSSLDLRADDYEPLMSMIKKKYERVNTTPSGYDIFDNEIFRGGFEASRLYIFAGAPGSGKSTIICNFMMNAATKPSEQINNLNGDEGTKVFIYISLENTVEETFLRLYQSLFHKTQTQAISDVTNGVNIKAAVMNELDKTGSTIILKYFPAMSISALDIMSVVDEAKEIYGVDSVKGLYVDYLDLLRTDVKYDAYRIELGHITLSLKTVAVTNNIPVIVPTQLNRGSYDQRGAARDLSLSQITESVKKIEHADFVCMLSKDDQQEDVVHMKVGKSRSGKSDFSIDFKVNFEWFKFLNGTKVTNDKKPDATTPHLIEEFSGFSL